MSGVCRLLFKASKHKVAVFELKFHKPVQFCRFHVNEVERLTAGEQQEVRLKAQRESMEEMDGQT